MLTNLKSRNIELNPFLLNNQSANDVQKIMAEIEKGKTYCFIGSSGVGKSTLINNLIGEENLETASISISTGKGRHTTSRRELIILENGGILIDTPGMREVGLTEAEIGVSQTFDNIIELTKNCKFANCSHTIEKGCAVLKAVNEGLISKDSFDNYHKIQKEQMHFTSTIAEKRKKDKEFGKMIKSLMKNRKKNEF